MKAKLHVSLLSVFLFTGLLATALPASAVDSTSIEIGSGNKTSLVRLGMQWQWDRKWNESQDGYVTGYWDLNFAYWQGRQYRNQDGAHQNIDAIGFMPVFRFRGNANSGVYFDIGIGPYLLSDLYDNNTKQLSTHFQFGSHLGLGYLFKKHWEAGVRFQHFSNGSIKNPNDGVNFIVGRVVYHF